MTTPSKVKELDDEDYSYQAMQEPLYRVETGNYEYRLVSPKLNQEHPQLS